MSLSIWTQHLRAGSTKANASVGGSSLFSAPCLNVAPQWGTHACKSPDCSIFYLSCSMVLKCYICKFVFPFTARQFYLNCLQHFDIPEGRLRPWHNPSRDIYPTVPDLNNRLSQILSSVSGKPGSGGMAANVLLLTNHNSKKGPFLRTHYSTQRE